MRRTPFVLMVEDDDDDNFWIYGGDNAGKTTNDLWKFNMSTLQWVWLGGSKKQGNMLPIYGTQGVASSSNSPGFRQTSATWVDFQGNFWLYAGFGVDTLVQTLLHAYSDLWKFDPSTNQWTWMKGLKFNNGIANYGSKGIESPANVPPPMSEMNLTWIDSIGDLWLMDDATCLWKYRISTNNWIWMSGNNSGNVVAKYGTKGQASPLNHPGPAGWFTHWQDSKGQFWYYDGLLWKYQIQTDSWAWMWGDTIQNYNHKYGSQKCDSSNHSLNPLPRWETRACWTDDCDNFWMMGGWTGWKLGDLLFYSQKSKEWVLASGDTTQNPVSVHGNIHVSSPSNRPSSRCGAVPFKDNVGNLWLFGGESSYPWIGGSYYADVWMFTPDTTCSHCKPKPPLPVSLEKSKIKNAGILNLYPNPTHEVFFLDDAPESAQLKFSDLFGNEVKPNMEINNSRLRIKFDRPGAYILIWQNSVRKETIKLIVLGY